MKEIYDALRDLGTKQDAGPFSIFKAVYFLLTLIVLKLGELNEKIQKEN
jgi:hypothetical protein